MMDVSADDKDLMWSEEEKKNLFKEIRIIQLIP